MTPRLGKWISGTSGMNQIVVPYEQRADKDKWLGGPIYRLTDAWTVRKGLWEVLPDELGSVDQWAIDLTWTGAKINGSGSDHDIFAVVLDEQGAPITGKGVLFFTNPCAAWTGQDAAAIKIQDTRNTEAGTPPQIASCALPIFQSYAPSRGEYGAWSVAPLGRADVLAGIGLPLNEHISTFGVWQAVAEVTPPGPEPEPTSDLARVWQLLIEGGLAAAQYSPNLAVARAISIVAEVEKQWKARGA